ncbi:MAG: FlgD immunoglobulin-like domain containing protein [bacterium]
MKSVFFFGTLIVVLSVLSVADSIASCEAPEMLQGDSRWYGTHPQVLYTISTLNMPDYLDNEGVISHMQAAAASWSAAGYYFDFLYNGSNQAFVDTFHPCGQQTNHNNLFGWDDYGSLFIGQDDRLYGILGVTLVCKTQTQGNSGRWLIDFVHAVLNYAIDDGSHSYWWSLNPPPPEPGDYRFDVQSTVAHEFGHWLKLTHTPSGKYPSWPTMEESKDDLRNEAGQTAQRSLECEDQWGISQIYDGTSSAPPSSVHIPPPVEKRTIPAVTELVGNYPNPFNPETWIAYKLAQESDVTIRVYDTEGKAIRTLQLGRKPAGMYVNRESAVYWDGKNDAGEVVSSGLYFYSLITDEAFYTKRMVLTK